MVSDLPIFAQKWLKIAGQIFFFGLRHSLLIDLSHDQHQHPTVNGVGVSRPANSPTMQEESVAVAVGVSDM